MSQTIGGFGAGLNYDLSFQFRNVTGSGEAISVIVLMDGVELGRYKNTSSKVWQKVLIKEISPGLGDHTFTFTTDYNDSGSSKILIDDVKFANSEIEFVETKARPNIARGPKKSYVAFTVNVAGVDVGLQVYFDGSVNIINGDVFSAGFNRFVQDVTAAWKATKELFSTAYKNITNDVNQAYNVTADAFEAAQNVVQDAVNTATKAVVGGLKKAGNAIKKFFNYYVDGSTVYFDPSGIGTYVAGNPMAITGSDGSFEMTLPENPTGQLVGYGGTITATAQPNDAVFTAVATASVVSPLTTLVNDQVRSGSVLSTAVTTIDAALGLPATYNLNASGTMENALQGDEDAARAYAAEVKVYVLAQETAALLSGRPGAPSKTVLMTNAFATLANILQTSNATYDFTNASNINSVIQATASASNITISSNLSNGGATVIARLEQAIEGLSSNNATAPGTLEFLQNVAAYQRIAGGSVASQLTAAGNGSISISDVTSNVTSSNLTVWAANTTIGNLRPPVVTLVTDANAPTPHAVAGVGQLNYIDFPVTVAGTSSSLLPISVSYNTSDDSAVAARGDYTATNGTLTWAPGDNSTKYIRVPIGTGSQIDIYKQFNVSISNPANSILEYTRTVATIDYSIFNTTTELVTTQSTATAFSPVTFTATSSYLDSANSPASGMISFYDGSTLLSNVTLNAQGVATYSTSSLSAGNHTISARYSGSSIIGAVYNPSVSANLTETIIKANQTITLDAISDKTYGAGASNLSGNTTWNLPINYSIISGPVSINSGVLTVTGAGHVVLEATQAGNDWVNPAPAVDVEFEINPAILSVVVDSKSFQYGNGTLPTLTYSTTGFVLGQNISLATSALSVSTVSATSHAGTYDITGTGLVVPNYNVQYVNGSLTITPAALTVTAADKSMTYGSTQPALTYSISGFVNGDTSANLTALPLVTTVPATSNVGVYQITASGVVDNDYTVSYVPASLTITKADLLISAANNSMTYGGSMPALTVNYNGLVNGDTSANFTAVPTLRTVLASSDAGNYTITADSAINNN